MLLTDVLTSTNMNPDYYKFIPSFIKAWKKLFPNVNIHIIVIAEEIIEELQQYKQYLKLFKPIKDVETSFIAQNIRLFYPALINQAKGGIIITDMDMIPMNTIYYTEPIKDISHDKFICYRPLSCVGKDEMVICYNIAHQNIWSEIFNIKTEADIIEQINSIYKKDKYIGENANKHYKPYWITDQLYLYEQTQKWNKNTNNLIILDDSKYMNRLDKLNIFNNNPNIMLKELKYKQLSDFHMIRPYNKFYNQIDSIINLL